MESWILLVRDSLETLQTLTNQHINMQGILREGITTQVGALELGPLWLGASGKRE